MDIILAIDIIEGKCVRLTKGDYATKKIYASDPLKIAKEYEAAGFKRLHLIDLDGAKAKKVVNLKVLETIATNTDLIIDFGGGLNSIGDFASVFDSGASMATVGSLAANNRELTLELLNQYSKEKLILGSDCKDRKIAVSGWQEVTDISVLSFITTYLKEGFEMVISTDISKDGMLKGPSFDLYKEILKQAEADCLSISLIASGGVSSIKDLDKLNELNLFGSIIGKAFYENKISLEDLAKWEKNR
ncbi:MAG: 1-(5-phosphoribosyl)-5-[(5-phosphoribosylamino)methylideneamino] imidazole-4-carboxamide isomerase [Sphaerochaetaceae bacterium]